MLKKFLFGLLVVLMMGFSFGCEQPTDNPGGGGYEQPSGGSGGQEQQQPGGGF